MASPVSLVAAGLVMVTPLWWRLVFDWLDRQSSDAHRVVLLDPDRSHIGIDVHSEDGPYGIEKQSGFGRFRNGVGV